ncbi:MAG: hypothetical protein Q4A11_03580 [Brachymonas sp.]|nr:hypothetical protein [Brachymonas sp.]
MAEPPTTFWRTFGNALQALMQIALDGANVHAKAFGQLMFVERAALVQQRQDARKALGELFAFGVCCLPGTHFQISQKFAC